MLPRSLSSETMKWWFLLATCSPTLIEFIRKKPTHNKLKLRKRGLKFYSCIRPNVKNKLYTPPPLPLPQRFSQISSHNFFLFLDSQFLAGYNLRPAKLKNTFSTHFFQKCGLVSFWSIWSDCLWFLVVILSGRVGSRIVDTSRSKNESTIQSSLIRSTLIRPKISI